MKKIILLLLVSNSLYAFSKKDLSLALGAQTSSLTYKRGIITHKGYQIIPIYALSLFHKNIFAAGSALYYQVKLNEKIKLTSRLNFNSTNDRPLFYSNEDEEDRIRRDRTSEFDTFIQYDFTDASFIRLDYSKDLVAHKGNYAAIKFRYDLINSKNRMLFEPGFFISTGMGDQNHNEYLYGLGASSGKNNIEYGFSITSSKAIDNLWPTLKVTQFEILGQGNKNASYVQETKGFSIEALFAMKVW